jgi:hypothetical protein
VKKIVIAMVFLFVFMFKAAVFVDYAHASSEFSLSNKDANTNTGITPQAGSPLVGKIVETMDGGGYTYILLQTRTKQVWVAIGKTKVSVGQDIALMPGMEMIEFNSKSLNRTFDSIIFSEGPITQQGAASGQEKAQHGGGGLSTNNYR